MIPGLLFAQLTTYCTRQGITFPLSRGALWQHLVNDGYAVPDNKQNTKAKKIEGKTNRYLWLKKNALDLTEEVESEGG